MNWIESKSGQRNCELSHTHARVRMHTHTGFCQVVSRQLSSVESHTLQLVEPLNFPHPFNTTLLHEFDLTATQILEYSAYSHVSHTSFYANDGVRLGLIWLAASTFICKDLVASIAVSNFLPLRNIVFLHEFDLTTMWIQEHSLTHNTC